VAINQLVHTVFLADIINCITKVFQLKPKENLIPKEDKIVTTQGAGDALETNETCSQANAVAFDRKQVVEAFKKCCQFCELRSSLFMALSVEKVRYYKIRILY
jgi:hypothetical protein